MTDLVADLGLVADVVKNARAALQDGAPILCDAQMVAAGITRRRLPADNEVICTLQRPAGARAGRTSCGPPAARRRSICGRAPRRRGRRDRQRADRAVPPARAARRTARRGRPRSSASRSGSSARRSPRRRWRRTTSAWSTWSCAAVAAAARSPRPPSTRSRARKSDGRRARTAVGRRARTRRPGTRHGQGGPADRCRRRDRVPQRAARPQHRARRSPRRTCGKARSRSTWSTRSPPRPPIIPAATRARSTTSTPTVPRGSPRISTPAATSSYWPRATRSSTAPTCTCTSGWPTATRRGRPRRDLGQRRGRRTRTAAVRARRGAHRAARAPCHPTCSPTASRSTDAAAVMKLGRTFHNVREAFELAGRADEAWYVERATTDAQRTAPLDEVDPDDGAVLLARPAPEPDQQHLHSPGAARPRTDGCGRPSSASDRPGRSG